ncbi:MAG: hypothetical protein P4M11_00755 [Candidatus Pacebacteria bacterium]|nr:hypothetical protein [Candidatus Paceibacterota bacterium]
MKSLLAIIIVLVVAASVVGAYYFGVRHALAPTTGSSTPAVVTGTSTAASQSSTYYTDISSWQTSTESQAGFSIAYPIDFAIDENMTLAPSTDWRVGANGDTGVKVFALTVPRSFEPQTNFVDATLTVGYSKNATSVAHCMTNDASSVTATSSAILDGQTFTVFNSGDAGAGNLYKTTSYRTLHGGTCYAVEYTVHSAQLGNYPASYNLKQYSDQTIDQLLDRIVGTFKFL